MTEEQKEKFRKQLESYKKDLLQNKSKQEKKNDSEKEKFLKIIEISKQKADLKASPTKESKLSKEFNISKKEIKKIDKSNKEKDTKLEKNLFIEQIKKTESISKPIKENKIEKSDNNDVILDKKNSSATNKESFFELKEKENKLPKKEIQLDNEISNNSSKEQQKIKKTVETKKENLSAIKKELEIKEDKHLNKNISKNITNKIETQNDTKQKKSKLAYIIIPLLLILAFGIYYIYNNIQTKQKEKEIELSKEKAVIVADSILLYEKENTEKKVIEKKVSISDTIFNIVSDYPEAYYVVIGSYADIDNAEKLQKSNPTIFESYIFEGKSKRVALLIGDNENKVLENLEIIRFKYPDAWIMYNKN